MNTPCSSASCATSGASGPAHWSAIAMASGKHAGLSAASRQPTRKLISRQRTGLKPMSSTHASWTVRNDSPSFLPPQINLGAPEGAVDVRLLHPSRGRHYIVAHLPQQEAQLEVRRGDVLQERLGEWAVLATRPVVGRGAVLGRIDD